MYFFLSPVRTFLCGTYCDSTWIIAGTSSCENNTQWRFHVSFSTYITCFILHLYNIYYSGILLCTNWCTYNEFSEYFFKQDNELILSYLADCLSQIILLVNISILSYNSSSRFSMVLLFLHVVWTVCGSFLPNHQS